MTLDEYQVAALLFRGCPEKMVEAYVVQGRGRGEAGDVAAQFGVETVGPDDHGQRVPAYQRTDAPLHARVARRAFFPGRRDGIQVRGIGRVGQVGAGFPGPGYQLLEQVVRPFHAFLCHDRVQRFKPFLGFLRVVVCYFFRHES